MIRLLSVCLFAVGLFISPAALTGCAYTLSALNYPETTVSGTWTCADGKPAQDKTISLVLVRGRGYDLACQDAVNGCLQPDCYAYMTAKTQTDMRGAFCVAFPEYAYKSCGRAILLPGLAIRHKSAGIDDLLLLYSEGGPQAKWQAVLDRNGKTRNFMLQGPAGKLVRPKKTANGMGIQATVNRAPEHYSMDLRITTGHKSVETVGINDSPAR